VNFLIFLLIEMFFKRKSYHVQLLFETDCILVDLGRSGSRKRSRVGPDDMRGPNLPKGLFIKNLNESIVIS
jgi:hypothetical protein